MFRGCMAKGLRGLQRAQRHKCILGSCTNCAGVVSFAAAVGAGPAELPHSYRKALGVGRLKGGSGGEAPRKP